MLHDVYSGLGVDNFVLAVCFQLLFDFPELFELLFQLKQCKFCLFLLIFVLVLQVFSFVSEL
jgi:hypothetical protein